MKPGHRAHVGSSEGLALFGVLVILAALAGIAFVVGAQILLGVTVSKEDETRRQLDLLVRSVIGVPGDPDGFVSDVGRVPKSLEELNNTAGPHTLCNAAFNPTVVNDHLVDGSTEHRGHVRMGWNGPYVKEMFASGYYLVDGWGQKLQYTCPQTTKPATEPTTNGLALTLRTGQITSAGADGTFGTQDDIKSDEFYDNGHIFMTVTVGQSSATPQSIDVVLHYPLNGEQTSVKTEPATLGTEEGSQTLLVFQSVPAGIRLVEIILVPRRESIHVQYEPNIANAMAYVVPIK
jgi:hypothetical protein